MSNNTTNWILQLIDRVSGPAKKIQGEVDGIEKKGNKLGDCFKRISAIDISAIGNSVTQLSNRFTETLQPGINFQSQLAEVSAITGVTGQKLNDLGDNARKTAKAFGGDAAAQLEAYKTVLSRLGPDIANSPKALDAMGQQIQTLSKTMGGDAVGATNALTTAMLQYQVDLSNPITASAEMAKMMNTMAAGAKYGAAEVPQVSAALEQTGVAAKLAKLSFEETNAAIQAMATGGKYGSEAGVALRNVLTTISAPSALSKDAVGVLGAYKINMAAIADSSKPFAERLKLLGPIQNDINALTAVFGKENAANAQILLRNADAQVKMTEQITGTNVAQEQAGVIMDTFAERAKRTKAFFDDLKISFFNVAGSLQPFVEGGAQGISILADLKNASQGITVLKNAFNSLEIAQKLSSAATKVAAFYQTALNLAMNLNPIAITVIAIAALAAGVAIAWNKFEGFRKVVLGLWEVFKQVFTNISGLFSAVFSPISEAIEAIKNGEWTKAAQAALKLNPISITARVAEYAASGGLTKGIGEAYQKGAEKGTASFKADKLASKESPEPRATGKVTTEKQQSELSKALNPKPISPLPVAGGIKPEAQGSQPTSPKPVAEQTAKPPLGDGGHKAITMNLTVNNHFNASPGMDIRKIADQIMGMVNDRLRDASLAI